VNEECFLKVMMRLRETMRRKGLIFGEEKMAA